MADNNFFYDLNPVGVIDQNQWTLKDAEVNLAFRAQALYTPLIDWDPSPMQTGAVNTEQFELMESEVDSNPIPMTANYIADAQAVDSRSRKFTVLRYGDKVQLHESSNIFNMWRISGGRDWRPLLRGLLGYNVVQKHEALARNIWFKGSKQYWTYQGSATNFATLTTNDKFSIDQVKNWNLWLGNTGSPVIPGDQANAKLAVVPPGATYDFIASIAASSNNETALWRDSMLYAGQRLNYEIGSYMGVRFIQAPSNKFGINPNVLYNAGTIAKQYGVTEPIHQGDGAPDPQAEAVDGVWFVGQSNVTHYIQLEDISVDDFKVNEFITLHIKTTNEFGVPNGVDPFDGRTIVRRVIKVDAATNRLTFDRPIGFNYTNAFAGKSITGNADASFYAYVTKGVNVGWSLVLGSRGGVQGKVMRPLKFYEPKPIDDFDSVWRFTWDAVEGLNIADPNYFTLYFFAVSIPKPGGVG